MGKSPQILEIDAANGDPLWNFCTPRGSFYRMRMRPLVDGGRVYAGTQDDGSNTVFLALDARYGESGLA